jgi:Ran GTPase-activating protein (RanGAP) involved in mRNA processing and transport
MSDSSVVSIAQMCGSLMNLITLKLVLSCWNCVSDRAFDEMHKQVSQLTLLTQLEFNLFGVGFDSNNLSDISVVSIAQMCGSLKNLTILNLDLSWWKCGSDRAFEEMNKQISQLTQLTHLDFNLNGLSSENKSMTDSSVMSIAQMCGSLRNLTILKLYLSK